MSRNEIIRSEDATGVKTQSKRVDKSKVEIGKKPSLPHAISASGVHNMMNVSNHAVDKSAMH